MFSDLNVFRTAFAMAQHAGHRQALVAENMANADTPGFQPKDMEHFKNKLISDTGSYDLRATRPGHIGTMSGTDFRWSVVEHQNSMDPNENGVSVEEEMLRAVDVRRQHDRALAIYRSGLSILRTSLGRGA